MRLTQPPRAAGDRRRGSRSKAVWCHWDATLAGEPTTPGRCRVQPGAACAGWQLQGVRHEAYFSCEQQCNWIALCTQLSLSVAAAADAAGTRRHGIDGISAQSSKHKIDRSLSHQYMRLQMCHHLHTSAQRRSSESRKIATNKDYAQLSELNKGLGFNPKTQRQLAGFNTHLTYSCLL